MYTMSLYRCIHYDMVLWL
uniref:Uncharacterized protein n=1 Tax=Arundo donax TaxID=35708 RepID=A0A0A9FB25_ARUDO